MSEAPVKITEIPLGDDRIEEFVAFHWRHYRGDTRWVPQLDADLLGNKVLGTKGLLRPEHPYHDTATVTHFLAHRDGTPVGRVSASISTMLYSHRNPETTSVRRWPSRSRE